MVQKEKDLLCQAWREGYRRPGGLIWPCGSSGEATRIRFAMYRAVKNFRKPENAWELDEELRKALESCSIMFVPGDPTSLHIQQRAMGGAMSALVDLLQDVPAEPIEKAAAESQARLLDKLALTDDLQEPAADQSQTGRRTTPYYTREK